MRRTFLTLREGHRYIIVNFIVGAVELTLELTATRIAAPYIGLTIYVWTSVIGVILASLALGYLLGGKLADKNKRPADVAYLLLGAAISIGFINGIKDPLLALLSRQAIPLQFNALLASCLLFAVPTILLGSVSPYLARLSISSVRTSGTQVSRINAAGTFGALFGTFFTGFFLFTLIGTRNILSLLGVLLIITSSFVASAKIDRTRLLVCFVAVLSLLSPSGLYINGVSKDFDTAYNRYLIRDVGSVRALQGDYLTWQSAVYKNTGKPYFPYTGVFSDIASLPPESDRYLVIGGGAFTLPGTLNKAHPQADTDVVEIDGGLAPISRQYFGFNPSGTLHIFTEDGRQYLNNNRVRYDVIYMDAFSNSSPPFQLLTTQAIGRLHASLAPNGVVAVNLFSKPGGSGAKYVASAARTYRQSFSNVLLFQIDKTAGLKTSQNILLLASDRPLRPAIDRLAAKNTAFRSVIDSPLVYKPDDGIILSDDFAPVEQMIAAQEN